MKNKMNDSKACALFFLEEKMMEKEALSKGKDISELVDIETVHVRDDLPVRERVEDYIRQIKNPYCYRSHGVVVRISFAGKKSFDDCLRDALFARDMV